MKRWFRPVAYSLVLGLAWLAIFGDAPADVPVAAPADVATLHAMPAAGDLDPRATAPAILKRRGGAWAPTLFAVSHKAVVAVAPVEMMAPPPAPLADIKILGWMQTEAQPHVFIEWNSESYTLTPTQSADEVYRFDGIGGGIANFTYLPTGETRTYAVSDPALIE